ncbi:putative alcohol dehydrogenase [Actinacidiphila reveromycinica]|uniref:2-deoxy-scyllo-inosamine dehydrogenase n=1 Tax=Actinacidiphila reveromycinica TaxID=659352 RepID=A0A7U3V0X4_9ACTN|nr:zinc-dependent alcohol dehydrogenase family protein [Streptomyces sp. SN-593]BBB02169.1 putative alcohol dehydrogenase [Streptomyces sp. SN-593]
MRAVVFEEFGRLAAVREVADPEPPPGGAVVRVAATGLCRSDWHAWRGHDDSVTLPHVPGHEFAGEVVAVGAAVRGVRAGARVTAPFVHACGRCASCARGDQQVCARQEQPGFTYWGSYAEFVVVRRADVNLVELPADLPCATAASLGCRFATAYRAVVAQGRVRPGEWVAVHGCGGVGLSAVMVAVAGGARVVAVDPSPQALRLAAEFGAAACLVPGPTAEATAEAVREATGGGAHVSLDALGSAVTCAASVAGLRARGRHVQVGLLAAGAVEVPMGRVLALELELLGSHGMAAHAYPEMLRQVSAGVLRPELLVRSVIGLSEAPAAMAAMSEGSPTGITVIAPAGVEAAEAAGASDAAGASA